MKKKSVGEWIFDIFNHLFLAAVAFVCLYPMLYVIFASFSEPAQFVKHTGALWRPLGFTLDGYKVVMRNPNILTGYLNTIFYVVAGTALNILMTSLGAYVLSRKQLMIKKVLMKMVVFTMYFGGGLIPTFLLVKNLGLYNNRLAMILPGAIATYNMIILKTSFAAIPPGLEECARIDGANDFDILFKIIIPVSKATMAVIILFYAVGHWNAWFNAMIYFKDRKFFPLQLLLREILIANSASGNVVTGTGISEDALLIDKIVKYCTVVVATVPILFIYPFCQKYFMKGVMVGSMKE